MSTNAQSGTPPSGAEHVPIAENGVESEPIQAALPSIEQLPDADIVIYDGKCGFCLAQVKRLLRWSGKDKLAFVSLHDPIVARRFSDLSHDQLMKELYLVDRKGNRYAGAAAFRYLSRHHAKLWFLAPLLHIPFSLPLWQWLYQQIARRRYRLSNRDADSCSNDHCSVHFD